MISLQEDHRLIPWITIVALRDVSVTSCILVLQAKTDIYVFRMKFGTKSDIVQVEKMKFISSRSL